jgi:hypothetical protein
VNRHEHTRRRDPAAPCTECAIARRQLMINAPGFESTTTLIAPGATLPIIDDHWIGAIVEVTAGRIQLTDHGGATHTFPTGSILWFSERDICAVRNDDIVPATIVSARRADPNK